MASIIFLALHFLAAQPQPAVEPDVTRIDFSTKSAEVESEFPVIAMKGPL